MPDKYHWPPSPEEAQGAARERDRERERQLEREAKALERAARAEIQQQSRNNRLIVGGKAHVKKHGLS